MGPGVVLMGTHGMTPPVVRRELGISYSLLAFTLLACASLARDHGTIIVAHLEANQLTQALEQGAFSLIVTVFLYGNLVYQVTRIGHLRRQQRHRPAPRAELERVYESEAPRLALLLPSYNEEERVVRQALLSAALQEYPNRRVILLIDDQPGSRNADSAGTLYAARSLPGELTERLVTPAMHFRAELEAFAQRRAEGPLDSSEETQRVAALYAEAAAWLEAEAANTPEHDHTDRHFIRLVLVDPAGRHRQRMIELETSIQRGRALDRAELEREYRRLATLFDVEITSFERKRYVNLSHEPNKAMNLNSYIGLMGGSYREVERLDGIHLEPARPGAADITVPNATYLVTLDADTLLASDYTLRLVYLMERPENQRVAVAQTPYSAVPGPDGALERIAGATTDIQYIIHQGFSWHDAAFWVGANACLRKAALDDLKQVEQERGFAVYHFISDRTVIEDTESSVDLIAKGWTLHNYPARLAYSATPADFGALLIQRRRWANGGLLILPKLLCYLRYRPWCLGKLAEAIMRVHYLTSIAGVNLGLLILLIYPFEYPMQQLWLPLAASPYFVLYGWDLVQLGYRKADVVRAYALNLLLLPVNLAGVCKSLHQAVTGVKAPFGRTPKVRGRTAVPAAYLLAEFGVMILAAAMVVVDLGNARWSHALFGTVNLTLLAYAMIRFIGVAAVLEDLRVPWFRPMVAARRG
jgi:cellulose synthase (UDP-forming)